MKQIFCMLSPKPFFHILHPTRTQIFPSLMIVGSRCEGLFLTLSMYSTILSMDMISIGSDIVSRSTKVYGICFLTWTNVVSKSFLDIFNLFSIGLRNVTTHISTSIEKHRSHQSIRKVFLEDPTFNFSILACVLK